MTSEAEALPSPEDLGYELTAADPGQRLAEVPPHLTRAGRYGPGSLIAGKYQLGEVLGEGGMGSVWVARNRTLDVEVAVKLMRSELADDVDGIGERMLQEARAAACIGHPAIIQVFDFGFTELGDPFIVMERLRGESLAQAIRRRGRVSATRAAQTLLPIVDALAAAHERKIVHRDLKPENIFLSRPAGNRLQPKVLDFGIAKLEQRAAGRLTRDGAVIGSPAYMAPEQLRGDPDVDSRADVWALGVVLYQMITGQRPFDAESYHASLWNITNGEPRPLSELGVQDPELAAIVLSCLMKDPTARCPSMRALGRALAQWLLARGVQEDIGQASLSAWLELPTTSGPAALSFFPSDAGELQTANRAAESSPEPADSSGTRKIVRTATTQERPAALRAAGGQDLRRYAALVAGAAIVAFVGAALFAAAHHDEEDLLEPAESAPALPQAAARPERVEPTERTAVAVISPLTSAIAPEPAANARPSTPRRPAPTGRASTRRSSKTTELKDPFD